MKTLTNFFFVLMVLSWVMMNADAGYISIDEVSKFESGSGSTNYKSKETCEQEKSSVCLDTMNINPNYFDMFDNEVVDYISKLNETSCSDIADCDAKFETASCDAFYEKIKNYDLLQVYCVKNIMKIEGKKLVESPSKKSAYEADKAAKGQLENAMNIARKAQTCGKDTLAYMVVRNYPKNLSNAQKIQLVETYATVKALLETGSLTSAKAEITAASADGVIVTEDDKTALNAYIDGCKP